jgi:uncharacterized protein (TIGR02246 family)
MNRLFAIFLLVVSMTMATQGMGKAPSIPEEDATQIHAALEGMDDAWNRHDMTAFVSHAADDVEWVNIVGMWWKGKAQVYKALNSFHKTMFKDRQVHEPQGTQLKMVAPNCVVANFIQTIDGFTSPSGQVMPAGRSVLTEVFVKRNGRWLLVRAQNTTIDEQALHFNPLN